MDVTIDKKKVFDSVKMNVSVVGRDYKDAEGNSLYDKVRIQDRDEDVLEAFYVRAMGVLALALRDFVIDRRGEVFTLHLDDRSNMGLVSDVSMMMEGYISNRISADWFRMKAVEYTTNFQQDSEEILSSLKGKLYYRNLPTDEDITNRVRFRCVSLPSARISGKHVYEILLFKNMLIADIDKELFLMYKTRKDYADALQSNIMERNSQLSSYISKHVKRITERIAAYVVSPGYCTWADNNAERMASYRYVLRIPCTWEPYNLEQLAEEMHTYVVNSCLTDYVRVNFPDEALIFKGASDAAWDNMKHLVSVRKSGAVYKPLQPF